MAKFNVPLVQEQKQLSNEDITAKSTVCSATNMHRTTLKRFYFVGLEFQWRSTQSLKSI